MHAILQPIGGHASILIRQGQRLTFGRTEWADHAFPNDPEMQPVHFAVQCDESGVSMVRMSDGALLVDGEAADLTSLKDGQTVQAGGTSFLVVMDNAVETTPDTEQRGTPEPSSAEAESDTTRDWVSAKDTLESLSLEPIDNLAPSPPESPRDLALLLASNDREGDALQVCAWCRRPEDAVAWVIDCVEKYLLEQTEADRQAIETARSWLADPSEENSRAAGLVAEALGLEGPAAWVAQTAFWSGENLSEPGLPAVKPPPTLTSAAAKSVVISLAFSARPEAPVTLMNECLQMAFDIDPLVSGV